MTFENCSKNSEKVFMFQFDLNFHFKLNNFIIFRHFCRSCSAGKLQGAEPRDMFSSVQFSSVYCFAITKCTNAQQEKQFLHQTLLGMVQFAFVPWEKNLSIST